MLIFKQMTNVSLLYLLLPQMKMHRVPHERNARNRARNNEGWFVPTKTNPISNYLSSKAYDGSLLAYIRMVTWGSDPI